MAKIGLSYIRYSKLTEAADGTPTFDGSKTIGKAVSANASITNNDVELYADDALAESDTSFQSGTITLGTDDDRDVIFADLLGHDVSEEGEVTANTNDVAPWVGVGRIVQKMVNNVRLYKAIVYLKVKFAEPSDDETTKGASVDFGTNTIEGKIATLKNGDWRKVQTFTTKEDAIDYIDGIFANLAPATYRVNYDVNGGTGSISAVTVTAGNSITVDSGSGITAPSDKEFAGWALSSTATTATIAGGSTYTPTRDITLYAVYVAST